MPYTSMSYHAIAERYNAINALPREAEAQIGRAIAGAAGMGARVLDAGGGAGRIGIPAAAAGCRVTVLDIEPEMLRAGEASAAERGVGLAWRQGDVTRLPFEDGAFDAMLSNNVLHLVEAWPAALAEAKRVLRPGGALLLGRDLLDPASRAGKLRSKWREIVAGLDPAMRPTAAAGPALYQAVAQLGGAPARETAFGVWTQRESIAGALQRMAAREHNDTWAIDDALLGAALPQLAAWAESALGDLEPVDEAPWAFMVSVARFA